LNPVSRIENLIAERQSRQEEAIQEVSEKWGKSQTITGLVLTVPYKTYSKVSVDDKKDKYELVESKEFAHFLPDELTINGTIASEKRHRGIYEVIVYNSKVSLSGNFSIPNFDDWKIKKEDILWEDAYISLGLSDLRSIQENIVVKWNDKDYFFNPGLESKTVIKIGMTTHIPLQEPNASSSNYKFSLNLNFNGSSSLNFIPLGKTTKVSIHSPWTSPSFDGAFLPDSSVINNNGFTANWEVLHLNRPYPQKFRSAVDGISESAFGVNLFVPVDEYQQSMRSAKYAVMFITLTFLVFFFVQILNRVKIHPIQYIMIGLALCVFYTLLIALSEHIAFSLSYVVSSISIVGLVTLYTKSMFKNRTLTIVICTILTLLYVFIYSIIQMEDYALLMGSIGLFSVLAIFMYLSRKIDWYAVKTKGEEAG
jgi:inner membrane protein